MTKKVIAIVGMAGSGKSEAASFFEEKGFARVRFGDITDDEIRKRGMEPGEISERYCRELLRKEMGMAAYSILVKPRIDAALARTDVVADGLYSWEEYLSFKTAYGDSFFVVAIFSSPQTRYARLSKRNVRPLTAGEALERDTSEIENLNKGGPIAMANYTIINELHLDYLKLQIELVAARLSKI